MADFEQPPVDAGATIPLQAGDIILHRVARTHAADPLDSREQQLFAEAPLPVIGHFHVRDDPHPDAVIEHLGAVHLLLAEGVKPQVKLGVMSQHAAQV